MTSMLAALPMRISAVIMASRTRGDRLAAESHGKRRHRIRLTGKRAGRRPAAFRIGTVERSLVRA